MGTSVQTLPSRDPSSLHESHWFEAGCACQGALVGEISRRALVCSTEFLGISWDQGVPINTPPAATLAQSKKTGRETTTRTEKRQLKDVWSTLLQIGVWDAPSDCRVHHWPCRTHHHSHCDNCQCAQILKVCQRGGLRGQGRLHRSDHQVLRLRRLLWHPLLHPPLHWSSNEASLPPHLLDHNHPWLQHQVSLRLHCERLDELGGLGVHLLPRLLHRRHPGGRLLHQGVWHQQWRRGPRLWCSASL